jgi:nucleoprotein TPR
MWAGRKSLFMSLFILSAAVLVGLLIYAKLHQSQKDLQKEVVALEHQNVLLEAKVKSTPLPSASPDPSKQSAEIQLKINQELEKIADFEKRKQNLANSLQDPAHAGAVDEIAAEIKDRNDAIQSLQLQLSANQGNEKVLEHQAEQAKQDQNLRRYQAIADINSRIRIERATIQNLEASLQALQIQGTESMDQIVRMKQALAQEKMNLRTLQQERDQVNVATAAQSRAIHEQVGNAKIGMQASEQGIREQIVALKKEIQDLEIQKRSEVRTTDQVRRQMSYLDQQIANSRARIDDLKGKR